MGEKPILVFEFIDFKVVNDCRALTFNQLAEDPRLVNIVQRFPQHFVEEPRRQLIWVKSDLDDLAERYEKFAEDWKRFGK